jgi:hypothetical protein
MKLRNDWAWNRPINPRVVREESTATEMPVTIRSLGGEAAQVANIGPVPLSPLQVTYLGNNGKWIVAPYGIINTPAANQGCNVYTEIWFTTTWGYPMAAGTPMQAIWYFADDATDCDDGVLTKDQSVGFTIPATPSGK